MDNGVDSKRLLQDAIGKLGKLAVENEQEILGKCALRICWLAALCTIALKVLFWKHSACLVGMGSAAVAVNRSGSAVVW